MAAIIRRYSRSIHNLLNLYAPLCDGVICLDNSGEKEKIVSVQNKQRRIIKDKEVYQKLSGGVDHD